MDCNSGSSRRSTLPNVGMNLGVCYTMLYPAVAASSIGEPMQGTRMISRNALVIGLSTRNGVPSLSSHKSWASSCTVRPKEVNVAEALMAVEFDQHLLHGETTPAHIRCGPIHSLGGLHVLAASLCGIETAATHHGQRVACSAGSDQTECSLMQLVTQCSRKHTRIRVVPR